MIQTNQMRRSVLCVLPNHSSTRLPGDMYTYILTAVARLVTFFGACVLPLLESTAAAVDPGPVVPFNPARQRDISTTSSTRFVRSNTKYHVPRMIILPMDHKGSSKTATNSSTRVPLAAPIPSSWHHRQCRRHWVTRCLTATLLCILACSDHHDGWTAPRISRELHWKQ